MTEKIKVLDEGDFTEKLTSVVNDIDQCLLPDDLPEALRPLFQKHDLPCNDALLSHAVVLVGQYGRILRGDVHDPLKILTRAQLAYKEYRRIARFPRHLQAVPAAADGPAEPVLEEALANRDRGPGLGGKNLDMRFDN